MISFFESFITVMYKISLNIMIYVRYSYIYIYGQLTIPKETKSRNFYYLFP